MLLEGTHATEVQVQPSGHFGTSEGAAAAEAEAEL
jgi:hypothetical protein